MKLLLVTMLCLFSLSTFASPECQTIANVCQDAKTQEFLPYFIGFMGYCCLMMGVAVNYHHIEYAIKNRKRK